MSPSVVFIETPVWTGSGVLIEGGYVVTNAHVVWPFDKARVVFPDGSEHLEVPVLKWDLLGDLAVIGPLETDVGPVALVDGEDLIISSDIALIGYPGESEHFPQPTLSRGIISRLREWDALEMTYFQTDATVAGGQSGGVLISEDGDVIGISGFSFTEAGYGLIASAADVLPRVERLIAGDDVAGQEDRPVPLAGDELEHAVTLRSIWDSRPFVVNEPIGTDIRIELEGEGDGGFFLVDVAGNVLLMADDLFSGSECGSAITELDAPYFVVPFHNSDEPESFRVRSGHRLAPFEDPDDGTDIAVGETVVGGIDYPIDLDDFLIDLAEGDTIVISVESVLIDAFLDVDFEGASDAQMVSDDDSGGGLFGTGAEIVYRAPITGEYRIVVSDSAGTDIGGYVLSVAEAAPGTAAVSPLISTATATTMTSPYGPMALYESARYPFSIQYPAEWAEGPAYTEANIVASFVGELIGELFVAEEDTEALELGETALAEYVDAVLSAVSAAREGYELVSREQRTTMQGLPAEVVVYTGFGGALKATRFIYLHEGRIGFNATYTAPPDRYEELEPLIEYSFDTFAVTRE